MDEAKLNKYPSPVHPGFWWAKSSGMHWRNLIVEVSGDSPFLKAAVVYNRGLLAEPIVSEWGPEIVEPKAD